MLLSDREFHPAGTLPIVIPARLNSSRLPGKLLLDRTGCPLITYPIQIACEAARDEAGLISNVVVASDSVALLAVGEKESVETFRSREQHCCGTLRVLEYLNDQGNSGFLYPAGVLILQADQVGLEPHYLIQMARLLVENGDNELMVTLSYNADSLPIEKWFDLNIVKVLVGPNRTVIDFSRDCQYLSAKQKHIPLSTLEMHVGVYGYTAAALRKLKQFGMSDRANEESLEQLSAMEAGIAVISMSVPCSVQLLSINTYEDYERFVEATTRT